MDVLTNYKQRIRASSDYAYSHWTRAIENYKHYLSKLDGSATKDSDGDYPFESKMTVAASYEIIETIMPRIIGKDPEWTTTAFEPSDTPYEQTAKLTIDSQYNNPKLELLGEPIYLKLFRGVKENLITGNAVLRAFWRRETTKRVRYTASLKRAGIEDDENIVSVLAKAKELGAESEVTFKKKYTDNPFLDDFDVRQLPFFFYYGDFGMVETGRFRYHIERDYMTFEELADEAGTWGYDKTIMGEIETESKKSGYGFTPEVGKDFLFEYNSLFRAVNDKAFQTDNDKIALLCVDKMWEGDKVHVIVNQKWTPTKEGMWNPYDVRRAPFIFMQNIPIPSSYHARSDIDWVKRIEDGMTDLLNMRYDNLLQSMLNIWLVDQNFVADDDEFSPIPNSITSVRDIDRAVRQISGKDVTASAYKEFGELYSMAQKISGTGDYVKGQEGQTLAGRTYGGLRLVQEAANARFVVKSRLFEKVTLKALGYFILELSRQFINKDRIARITGDAMLEAEELNPTIKAGELKQIKGYMDIVATPNSTMVIDQQAEAMQLSSVADRLSTQKGPFQNIPDSIYDKFLLKYFKAYGMHDAVYWIKEIKAARAKAAAEQKPAPEPQPKPQLQPPVAPTSVPILQSDQISNQPNPLEQLFNSQAGASGVPIA